ncbi:MAG: methylenetetrahydrofolate reductase, partial [Microbacterium sp.]
DLESSAQLVQLIDRVQAERAPYTEQAIPGVPGAVRVEPRTKVDIAVAAFPNGHPRSRHPREHIDALLAKQAAGATLAITQLFFHADDYLAFVQRSREAGVTIPILPGIMPITSPARLRRVLELSGEELPSELAISLEVEPTPEGQRALGIAYAADLARDVVAGGAPGVHLYAFNSHETVIAVLRDAGILTHPLEKEVAR